MSQWDVVHAESNLATLLKHLAELLEKACGFLVVEELKDEKYNKLIILFIIYVNPHHKKYKVFYPNLPKYLQVYHKNYIFVEMSIKSPHVSFRVQIAISEIKRLGNSSYQMLTVLMKCKSLVKNIP